MKQKFMLHNFENIQITDNVKGKLYKVYYFDTITKSLNFLVNESHNIILIVSSCQYLDRQSCSKIY